VETARQEEVDGVNIFAAFYVTTRKLSGCSVS
jgi:hypothetical protein